MSITVWVEFSDSTGSRPTAVMGRPSDWSFFEGRHIVEMQSNDVRYAAFYNSRPEEARKYMVSPND